MAKAVYVGKAETYTELEYIQSSGTQYIDTGFMPNQDTRVVFDFKLLSSDAGYLYGARGGSSDSYNNRYGILFTGSLFRSDYGTGNGPTFPSTYTAGMRYLSDKQKSTCYIEGASVANTAASFQSPRNMYLFGVNEGTAFDYGVSLQLYKCQIYDNGELIRDYVPCKRSDGAIGMYDKAKSKFYANAGSGSFTAGTAGEAIATTEVARKVKEMYVGVTNTIFEGESENWGGEFEFGYGCANLKTGKTYSVKINGTTYTGFAATFYAGDGWYLSNGTITINIETPMQGMDGTVYLYDSAGRFDDVSHMTLQIIEGAENIARKVKSGYIGVAGVARQFWASGAPIGELAVGSSVFMNYNGVRKEFIIVHKGLPSSLYDSSCDGTWLMMKDLSTQMNWSTISDNRYAISSVHTQLNETMFYLFDSGVQSIIKQVKIPYCTSKGSATVASGSSGLSTKLFLLSGYEVGFTTGNSVNLPADGAKLAYFTSGTSSAANSKRIAYLNGTATEWWLRSPRTDMSNHAFCPKITGDWGADDVTYSKGVRPTLILPSEILVDDNMNVIA